MSHLPIMCEWFEHKRRHHTWQHTTILSAYTVIILTTELKNCDSKICEYVLIETSGKRYSFGFILFLRLSLCLSLSLYVCVTEEETFFDSSAL